MSTYTLLDGTVINKPVDTMSWASMDDEGNYTPPEWYKEELSKYQQQVFDDKLARSSTSSTAISTSTPNINSTSQPTSQPTGSVSTAQNPNFPVDEALRDRVKDQVDNPKLAQGAEQTFTELTPQDNEFMSGVGQQVESIANVNTSEQTSTQVNAPTAITASQMNAATVDQASQATAAQGALSDGSTVNQQDVVQGQLSEDAIGVFTQEELDTRATVQGQLSSLFSGVPEGEIPIWAKPAVDLVSADLAAKGMARSTIARDSLYNAVIGSALQIAGKDADSYKQAWLTNMEHKNKMIMFNAANVANMDMQNASASQKVQIQNAQNFLQMDLQNLTNEQRTNEINHQARQQVLLSDQSAENAARKFNAENQQQVDQFNAQLATAIETDNATRADSMAQFNETQSVDAQKFMSEIKFNRDQFNAKSAQVIEQANVQWRRDTNKINTAGINAANQANAMNRFNMSNQALTFLWQENRDHAYWAFLASQNNEERRSKMAIAALTNETMADQAEYDAMSDIGGFIYNIFAKK